jgi:hypothetical protein
MIAWSQPLAGQSLILGDGDITVGDLSRSLQALALNDEALFELAQRDPALAQLLDTPFGRSVFFFGVKVLAVEHRSAFSPPLFLFGFIARLLQSSQRACNWSISASKSLCPSRACAGSSSSAHWSWTTRRASVSGCVPSVAGTERSVWSAEPAP